MLVIDNKAGASHVFSPRGYKLQAMKLRCNRTLLLRGNAPQMGLYLRCGTHDIKDVYFFKVA